MHGIFVTGTDTEIGKTWISLALITLCQDAGQRVAAMKPVASGCEVGEDGNLVNEDARLLLEQCDLGLEYGQVNPYAFEPPISPHLAAHEAGTEISLRRIVDGCRSLEMLADQVIVEGVGGWLAPLGRTATVADMAAVLQLPVVLVVGMRLGCLNHALLTASLIGESRLPFAGWVANCIDPEMERLSENIQTLRDRLDAPLLGVVPHQTKCEPRDIAVGLSLPIATGSG